LTINVRTNGFVGRYAPLNNQSINLNISIVDLIRGIITVGKSSWVHVFRGGQARMCEIGGLSLQLLAYITCLRGNLVTSNLYNSLDRSEKAAASYRLGMGVAKVVCEYILRIPWLLHVDPLIKRGIISLSSGSSQSADLVGQDIIYRTWHIVEAKGRSNHPPSQLFIDAKTQASRVISVNGTRPSTNCISILDLSKNPLRCHLLDPEKREKENIPTDFEIDERGFFEYYYELVNILKRSEIESYDKIISDVGGYKFFPLPYSGVHIGIYSELYDIIINKSHKWIEKCKKICAKLSNLLPKIEKTEKMSLGIDGFSVLIKREK